MTELKESDFKQKLTEDDNPPHYHNDDDEEDDFKDPKYKKWWIINSVPKFIYRFFKTDTGKSIFYLMLSVILYTSMKKDCHSDTPTHCQDDFFFASLLNWVLIILAFIIC